MDGNGKKVSVIIPTYKRDSKYLMRAIRSIQEQTYNNVEIVIVDDNPPESTFRKDIIKFMQQFKQDPNIVYFENPYNMGGALARNQGIFQASGEYITFLDDDDEYMPRKIEKQVSFMMANSCDMSFTDLKLVNNNKQIVDYRKYDNLTSFDKLTLLKYHLMRHLTGTPTFMYKALKLKEIGGFEDVKMGQEFYLMLKSIESGLKICYLKDCDVIAYRHNAGGISQGINKIVGEKALFNYKKKYFHLFSIREKMFINFRHYAVLAIAYKRNNSYLMTLFNSILMILASPIDFIIEITKFISNIIKKRKAGNTQ